MWTYPSLSTIHQVHEPFPPRKQSASSLFPGVFSSLLKNGQLAQSLKAPYPVAMCWWFDQATYVCMQCEMPLHTQHMYIERCATAPHCKFQPCRRKGPCAILKQGLCAKCLAVRRVNNDLWREKQRDVAKDLGG